MRLSRWIYGTLLLVIGVAGAACTAPVPPLTPTAAPEETTEVVIVVAPTITPTPVDYRAVRLAIGALSRAEIEGLDSALVLRWQAFLNGDDSAYRAVDVQVVEAMRAGTLIPIGGTQLTGIDEWNGRPVSRSGYMVYDHQTGEPTVVAWIDERTGDVVEARTGYRLNVIDPPGEWIETGPNGEQYYRYGFSYYRPWRRVLPDPVIGLIERFRTLGADHVRAHLAEYEQAAGEYDQGDLTLIAWHPTVPDWVTSWTPPDGAPPTLILPDSGTVDVRRERFLEAVTSGAVVVDRDSVWTFLQSSRAQNGYFYNTDVTDQQVVDALLTPYRNGHLYSDLEAAIILAGTYGGDAPLTIHVSDRFSEGAGVPRGGRKDVYIAAGEVADVILGYEGTMNARWPHEMSHILEFRDPRNSAPVRTSAGSRCEPLKYMLEYMWWVERYPHDAPDWDWMPVGSGLTLARLLTGTYPNSGC